WRNLVLRRRKRERRVAHLAALVSIHVAGFTGLAFDGHAVLERLQHTTWTTNDFFIGCQAAGDLDVRFTRDAGGDFDEPHLVALDQIHALLSFGLLRRRSRNT